jgi:hypothetical protein
MDHVYVVCTGERAEGHDPISAYSNFKAAEADARTRRGLTDAAWLERGDGYWMASPNGVDEVWIVRLPIDGKPDLPVREYRLARGVCPECGVTHPLRSDGMLRRHRKEMADRPRRWWPKCAGSHQVPAETSESGL